MVECCVRAQHNFLNFLLYYVLIFHAFSVVVQYWLAADGELTFMSLYACNI